MGGSRTLNDYADSVGIPAIRWHDLRIPISIKKYGGQDDPVGAAQFLSRRRRTLEISSLIDGADDPTIRIGPRRIAKCFGGACVVMLEPFTIALAVSLLLVFCPRPRRRL